jgi:hypothetical protein
VHFTLADLVADITQNACESGAELVELEIIENGVAGDIDGIGKTGGEFRFLVRDNGKGMSKEEMDRVVDPFVTDGVKHPHRKVGLGLPFLIQTAETSGGGWNLQSGKGSGTTASAWFDTGNVDTPPVGDLPGMFRTVLMFEGRQDIVIRRSRWQDTEVVLDYEIRKSELEEVLGGFEDSGSLILLGEYLRSLEIIEEGEVHGENEFG